MRAPEPASQDAGPPEPGGFEHRLRVEFDAAAAGILPPAPTGAAVITRRRHQRRAVTAAIAVAAAVALVTGGVTVLTGATRHAAPAVVPAHTRPETRIDLYGVTFGWLPPGVARYDDTVTVLPPTEGVVPPAGTNPPGPTVQQELALAPVAEVDQQLAGADPPSPATAYTVAVLRVQPGPGTGLTPDPGIELSRQWDRHQLLSRDWSATEVYSPGVPARSMTLIRREARRSGPTAGDSPPVSYALYVHVPEASAGVIITGPDPDTLGRIGAAVTVGPKPAGPSGPFVLPPLLQAAGAAFDGPAGAGMLGALTAPDQARPALTEALSRQGTRVHAIRFVGLGEADSDSAIRIGEPDSDNRAPLFLSATQAEVTVRIELLAADGQRRVTTTVGIRLAVTGDRWKVTTASYCAALTSVLRCPTVP
ncbi:hypothetical protein [Pseudofrankia asymbiotica]|uniref:Uncharacterized protein n=1 Tax=Pseudofrankia asymbiotica TaxID=1834516 RepID=A0A1V2II63_9ACTN|nr:hypothetical protein [Pseudofrankia asymbiotica]ONH32864.1 hypothetical protein BL253_03910 [Pseudofrankia asymbiotica]